MHRTGLATACAIKVGANRVELHVLHDAPDWRWEIRYAGGKTLDVGAAATKFSAQVAAQHALEQRMKRAGLYRRGPSAYRWE